MAVPTIESFRKAAREIFFDELPFEEQPRFNPTPLFAAARDNRVDDIHQLVRTVDINAVDFCGRNALQACLAMSSGGCPVTCQALIESHINVDHKDVEGNTALGFIVYHYHHAAIPNEKRKDQENLSLFLCLIRHGADVYGQHHPDDLDDRSLEISIYEKIQNTPELAAIYREKCREVADALYRTHALLRVPPELLRIACAYANGGDVPADWPTASGAAAAVAGPAGNESALTENIRRVPDPLASSLWRLFSSWLGKLRHAVRGK